MMYITSIASDTVIQDGLTVEPVLRLRPHNTLQTEFKHVEKGKNVYNPPPDRKPRPAQNVPQYPFLPSEWPVAGF